MAGAVGRGNEIKQAVEEEYLGRVAVFQAGVLRHLTAVFPVNQIVARPDANADLSRGRRGIEIIVTVKAKDERVTETIGDMPHGEKIALRSDSVQLQLVVVSIHVEALLQYDI